MQLGLFQPFFDYFQQIRYQKACTQALKFIVGTFKHYSMHFQTISMIFFPISAVFLPMGFQKEFTQANKFIVCICVFQIVFLKRLQCCCHWGICEMASTNQAVILS